jgi:hypothetical protein
VIRSSIIFKNCRIRGNIDFSNTILCENIDFIDTTIEGNVNFEKVRFCKVARFSRSEFLGNVSFGILEELVSETINDSDRTHFCENAYFLETRFNRNANFHAVWFSGEAAFLGAMFNESAFFADVIFENNAEFIGVTFRDNATFVKSHFHGEANFGGTRFIGMDGYFLDSQFDQIFKLKGAIFTRVDITWDSIKDHLEYDESAYLGLTKNYNNLGLFSDADNCYLKYRTLRRKDHLSGTEYLFDLIAWIPFGYGVHYYYPLFLMIGSFFVFAAIFLYGKQAHSVLEALDLSVVILTTTTQVGNLTGPCRFWSIVERMTGWLLMASFLVILARKTIR